MDKLWAPWRSKYIYLKKSPKCIFCSSPPANDRKKFIICRAKHSFAMLNLYPYNNGHVMIAPHRHVRSLETLSDTELIDIFKLLNRIKSLIDKKLKPDGYNIGINLGRIGGAGVTGHIHIHIVPRWAGDTNFMPVTADTKVVSESLEAMYKLLKVK